MVGKGLVIVWLLPDWLAYHVKFVKPGALTDLIMTTVRFRRESISGGFIRFENRKVQRFTVPLSERDICALHIVRMKKYSPTFPEHFKLVQQSDLDARVMIKCNRHQEPREECAARIFEWENSALSMLDNARMRRRILKPVLNMVGGANTPQGKQNQAVLELFFSGLRINEINNLREDDVDFDRNLIIVHQN